MRGLIGIGLMPEAYKYLDFHTHSNWEIVYYIEGNGIITVGGLDVYFKPGTIVCLPPDIPHREIAQSGYRDYYFMVEDFTYSGKSVPCFHDTENSDYLNILKQMYREYHLKQVNWRSITESLLGVLHQYMIAWKADNIRSHYVEELKGIIISNISDSSFNIERELKKLTVSPAHMRKLFKRESGRSPLRYLYEKRIEFARDLLSRRSGNGFKIKEIAGLCGFNDPYYFSRVFKKLSGICPEEWNNGRTDLQKN